MRNKSQIAHQALDYIGQLYDVEREAKHLNADERLQTRQTQSKPLADAFYQWILLQRQKLTDGSATAKALDYSLKRWTPEFDRSARRNRYAAFEINDLAVKSGFSCGGTFWV